jgi:RNA polymerase-binding transcription factor
MDQSQLEGIKTELEKQRSAVERQLSEHGAVAGGDGVDVSVEEGFADSAQATAERSQLISMVEGLKSQHQEVVAALARIDEGNYGKCERCGQDIPFERLEAIPTARLCVTCKQIVGNHH